jgi:hypothetical protein
MVAELRGLFILAEQNWLPDFGVLFQFGLCIPSYVITLLKGTVY